MPSTTFVPGTVITSAWLNEVNTFVFSGDTGAGVDPTGATDSTTGINAAIQTAVTLGARRFVLSGTYLITGPIILASGINYELSGTFNVNVSEVAFQLPAAGSRIVLDGKGTGLIQGTCSRAISSVLASTITDIEIKNFYGITGATLTGAGYTNGIFLDGASRAKISRNYLYGNGIGVSTATGNGDITVYAATNARVDIIENRCTSTSVGFNIALYNTTDFLIKGNLATGAVCGSSQNNGYGIMVYSTTTDACQRGVCSGNIISNTGGTGIYYQNVVSVASVGNTCTNVAQTQTDVGLPVGGIAFNGCTNASSTGDIVDTSGKAGIVSANGVRTIIEGGVVYNCSGPGFYLRGTGDGSRVTGQATNCAINCYTDSTAKADLYINVVSRSSKAGTNGVDLLNITGSLIKGISKSSSRTGLSITAGANNVIEGFVAMDNSVQTANTYDGIANQATGTKFIGCRSGNTGATGQRYGINSNGNYCSYQNNDLTLNQTDGASISGTNPQKSGNRMSTSATPGAIQGNATLVAGTITITTNEVRTGDKIDISRVTTGGGVGHYTYTITNATSFVVTSSNAADTGAIQWEIVH